ncbi:MAG TPA: AbrB/MazE/SpoVT family DNA-binding domain-containing protein [Chloroflexota bacterium]|nr:AbrB/MazE/SpoVT family DNA-binding domain-containing protein [Chloroflexota bacterium]
MRVARTRLGSGGRIVIPAEYRNALGLHEGDVVTMRLEGNEIRLYSFKEGVRRAQALVREFVPEGVSLADELIAERRREAALE